MALANLNINWLMKNQKEKERFYMIKNQYKKIAVYSLICTFPYQMANENYANHKERKRFALGASFLYE